MSEADAALPESAVAIFCTMLAMSEPGSVHAGVDEVARLATRASLSEFVWGLCTAWQRAGYPANSQWVVHALGLLGDDRVALALGQLILTWSGTYGSARAVACLDVFAAIGTSRSLEQLDRMSYDGRSPRVRRAALEKLSAVDAGHGMSYW
ncbi:hypothetical protein KHQ06_16100 [Nocardia tengchongensis]|uniref:HEAT repeat domain-containing protein n=1 Tax=Nocardia tengchongensis TaxID=2055889 RepID=A0ABX8CW77_9NOCA|nr:hypothetical protein [Nocardia tengchongensis]QVI24157.1 hypothetical protein KHQ06_16100 [Nocardia tengchongensis]